LDLFAAFFATEPASFRKEAAARLYANYGEPAAKLVEAYGSVRPMNKVASADYKYKYVGTPSLPDTKIYSLAKQAMDSTAELSKSKEDYEAILHSAVDTVIGYAKTYMQIRKQAADPVVASAAAAQGSAGLAKLLGLDDISDAQIKNEVFTTDMLNNMLAHSYQRSFMRAATNKAISKYSLNKIVEAFNRAVAKLPPNTRMVPATANQQLIEGMMIDELTKGSVPSKADTEIISNLASTLGKLETDKGLYIGNTGNA
jgi:hypothetical protein